MKRNDTEMASYFSMTLAFYRLKSHWDPSKQDLLPTLA